MPRSLDLHEKRSIYQELGVAEYWIVDLTEGRVLVHRLADDGAYHTTERTSGALTALAAPGLEIPVPRWSPPSSASRAGYNAW